jgi:hypothetical protein
MNIKKSVLLLLVAFTFSSCIVALVYGDTSGSILSVNPDPATPGTPMTALWIPFNNPSTEVTFEWLNPSFQIMQTDADIPVPTGSAGVFSPEFILPVNAAPGLWWVRATAGNEVIDISMQVTPFTVHVVPEVPIIGTIGAVFAMLGAVIYKKKKNTTE